MATGNRPTFIGFSTEFVATRIGITWPTPKGEAPDGGPELSAPYGFESRTYAVLPSGLITSRAGTFPAAIVGSARPSASWIGVMFPDA